MGNIGNVCPMQPTGSPIRELRPEHQPSSGPLHPHIAANCDGYVRPCHEVCRRGSHVRSYGSMARFKCVERIKAFGADCLVGAGGDISDFQYLTDQLDSLIEEDEVHDDGTSLNPNSIHKYLSRVMYNRRSKMDPLWNAVVVAGFRDGKSFLGTVDMTGTQFEDDIIATGFGAHLALPLMREAHKKWGSNMTKEQHKRRSSKA